MPVDKMIALSALTVMEKECAKLRTTISKLGQPDVSSFNELERVIVNCSINVIALLEMQKLGLSRAVLLSEEAFKWWKRE